MAGWMVSLGGMGSGMLWSSAYAPRGGLFRGGGADSSALVGETSVRRRRRDGCAGGGGFESEVSAVGLADWGGGTGALADGE